MTAVPRNKLKEQRHRRVVLLALGALLLLSISPVFGHHVVRAVDWLPASLEHLGPFCMVALHHLLAPVHAGFHYLLLAGILYAAGDRARAAWQLRQNLQALDSELAQSYPALEQAAQRLSFPVRRIHVVTGLPSPAFASGWVTPRIHVAKSLLTLLTDDELEAVLAHEVAHVQRRDPLRFFLLRALASTVFWLPAFRRLVEDLADEAEIAADDAVQLSLRLPLASAMLRVAGADMGGGVGARTATVAVGFERGTMLERRIRRLAGEAPAAVSHVSRRSIAAAALALVAVWASGVMVLHPLPPDDHGVHSSVHSEVMAGSSSGVQVAGSTVIPHCDHHRGGAWSHLFCRARLEPGARCPHEDDGASPRPVAPA